MIPYSCQWVDQDDIDAVCQVLRGEFLTQGPAISEFERQFARRHDVAEAVAVSNATAGLHMACLALGATSGSRIWTSPNSFVASANCALYCGAEVDFVDIDPFTRNISIEALKLKLQRSQASGKLPAIIIPVHFAGMPCEMLPLRELADSFGFKILEDASHAVGSSYQGHPIGSCYADVSVFSLHAVKIITTGEGGVVTTQDASIARRLRLLRSHGVSRDSNDFQKPADGEWYYEQVALGFNYRMTDIQAALGLSQLSRLENLQLRREVLARRYDELLSDLPLILPSRIIGNRSSWHLYVVELDEKRAKRNRGAVYTSMRADGVGVNVHYIPIHLQPWYRRLGFSPGDFPCAERYYERALTIPLYPRLSEEQQDIVVKCLRKALQ